MIPVADSYGITRDPVLPELAAAITPATAERVLRTALRRRFRAVELRAIRVIRYKPQRRCLVEYDLAVEDVDGRPEQLTAIGKVRSRSYGKSGPRLLSALRAAGFDDAAADGISVPEPLGHIASLRMWLQRKVSGVDLSGPLAGPNGVQLARRVAGAAAKLHRAGVPTERRHLMEDELRILHDCLPRVVQQHPEWETRIPALLSACVHLGESVPAPALAGIHRDFYPQQIVLAGERLYLLDFDLYCSGDPALDLGNFIGHVAEEALRSRGSISALAEVERALEDRFCELSGDQVRAAVRAYALLTLVRHIYLSAILPGRAAITEALLEHCEQRLPR
jgi:aminoglycoside phosphotransferase (APT) family kinase protein